MNLSLEHQAIAKAVIFFFAFGLFHTVAARAPFKNKLESAFGSFFMIHFWRIIYCTISFVLFKNFFIDTLLLAQSYDVVLAYPIWAYNICLFLFLAGIALTYWAFFQFDYLYFWGVKQFAHGVLVLLKIKAKPLSDKVEETEVFHVRGVYSLVRHPMMAGGWLVALSLPPTKANLVYMLCYSAYMFIGGYAEEHASYKKFGQQYLDYKKNVGAFLPSLKTIKRLMT